MANEVSIGGVGGSGCRTVPKSHHALVVGVFFFFFFLGANAIRQVGHGRLDSH